MDDDLRSDLTSSFSEKGGELSTGGLNDEFRDEPKEAPAAYQREPDKGRDASGRFAPSHTAKDPLSADQEPQQKAPDQQVEGAPATQALGAPALQAPGAHKAPASWTPEAREEWAKLPLKVQAEVSRRERDVDNTLRTTAEARQFHAQVNQVLQPYMPMIQAEGSNPLQAIQSVMQTAAFIRTAPPLQKAAAIADLIMQHGVDINMLDNQLAARASGQRAPQDPMAQYMAQLDQKLAPITQFMQNQQQSVQQRQQQVESQAQQTLQQFMEDPANEFANDVIDDMADMLELAAKHGRALTLQDAYKRATLAHPTISALVERRKLDTGAAQQSAAAQRARNAAVSVSDSGAPSQSGEDEGDDVRSAILASARQLSSRR